MIPKSLRVAWAYMSGGLPFLRSNELRGVRIRINVPPTLPKPQPETFSLEKWLSGD